jgi:FMN-dependent NADH-azoreductase
MSQILHIDASPRGDRSISRSLAQEFIASWQTAHPDDTVAYRDLGHNPVPFVDENWIAAAFSSPADHSPELQAAISVSDNLVEEFLAADRYVFAIPMYNLNIPAAFKAYIDQIVRAGKTFAVGANGFEGLVTGKKLLIITSQGGIFKPGTPNAAYNFHEPYLRTIFGFMGVTDVTFITADGLNMGDTVREQSLIDAKNAIKEAIANW